MKNIHVLIVLQGEEILKLVNDKALKPGAYNQPTNVKDLMKGSVFAISDGTSDVNVETNDSKLLIDAEVGDVITFSINTQSKGQVATPFFYRPKQEIPGTDLNLFVFTPHKTVFLPPSEDPTESPQSYSNLYSKAQSFIPRSNQELRGTLTFGVIDNSSEKILGYFRWDLSLEIISKSTEE